MVIIWQYGNKLIWQHGNNMVVNRYVNRMIPVPDVIQSRFKST